MGNNARDDDINERGSPDDGVTLLANTKTKQQRKEEGRLRAIAMARQKALSALDSDPRAAHNNSKRANRKSARHGARNQHRHKHFARWILERFPHVLDECVNVEGGETTPKEAEASANGPARMHILDVAGGKGELSARLSLCHSLNVIMVDPRLANVADVYMSSVVPKLPNKWQRSVEERVRQSPNFVCDTLDERFSQLVMPFTAPSCVSWFEDETLDRAVRNSSLIVGLHADGATEAIVDAALLYHKPFVVVPCCVFPNLFNDRYINVPADNSLDESSKSNSTEVDINHSKDNQGEAIGYTEKRVPVRTHDQFCKYLLAKDARFVMEVLPFEGRNIAIWWDGQS